MELIRVAKVHQIDHPANPTQTGDIRDQNTGTKEFRELLEEVSMLMGLCEVTRAIFRLKKSRLKPRRPPRVATPPEQH